MRPVLFLDIDGVLNSTEWQKSYVPSPLFHNLPNELKHAEEALDPIAMGLLNDVVEATNCLVVLSSTWRKQYPLHIVTRLLRYRGFQHRLFGATPDLSYTRAGPRRMRGDEIDWWLKELGEPCRFAIVDDDSDMEPHMDRLVQTSCEAGLTFGEAVRLISLLGEK